MRHHHGDGDGALPVLAEGVPFDAYLARMREDIEGVRWLCDTLEGVAGELPNRDTSTRLLAQRLASARRFMDALSFLPTTMSVATPADIAAAARQRPATGTA